MPLGLVGMAVLILLGLVCSRTTAVAQHFETTAAVEKGRYPWWWLAGPIKELAAVDGDAGGDHRCLGHHPY